MLAGVSYEIARDEIYPSGRTRLTHTKDLHATLTRLGRQPSSTRRIGFSSKSYADLECDARRHSTIGYKSPIDFEREAGEA